MAEYIDREAVSKVITGIMSDCKINHKHRALNRNIRQIPTADVAEVRHGHWIDKPSGRYMHMGSFCSVCGTKSGIGGIESNRHKPYCPNCGAKMDGKG